MANLKGVFSAICLPMSLAQWTPTPISSYDLPTIVSTETAWKISTRNSAGGYLYLLDTPIEATQRPVLSWKWTAVVFPSIRKDKLLQKEGDDFPVRVGVLFSGSKSDLPVPKNLRKQLDAKHYSVSRIMFYSPLPYTGDSPIDGKSPYSDKITYRLLPLTSKDKTVQVTPFIDVGRSSDGESIELNKLKIIGLWVFADSDNSHSSSVATLEGINIKFGEAAKPPL